MAIRMIFYWSLSLVVAGMISIVALVMLLFFEFMPTSVLMFFAICCVVVGCVTGSIALRKVRATEKNTGMVSLLLPLGAAAGSVAVLAAAALPTWSLPRTAQATITDIGRGNYATFMIDNEPFAYDFDADQLFRWQLTSVNSSKEIISSGPFMHYASRVVGTDGKEFKIHIPERHRLTEVFIPPDATRIFYEVSYSKEENGVWRKPMDGEDEPERYAEYGRDLFWTRDLDWTFMCTGRGLEKVDRDGNPTVIVPAPDGYSVEDPVMSADETKIAFVLKAKQHEGHSKVCVSSLDGANVSEIYVAAPKETVSEPQWSGDDQEVGFLYRGDTNNKSVRTIATVKADGSSSKVLRRFTPGSMLTHPGVVDFCWSPDDQRIVFTASIGASLLKGEGGGTCHKYDLYVIDRDGGCFRRLTKLNQTMKSYANGFPVVWWPKEAGGE